MVVSMESDQWLSFLMICKGSPLLPTTSIQCANSPSSWLNEWFLIETYPTSCQKCNANSKISPADQIVRYQKYGWRAEIFICFDHLIKENYPPQNWIKIAVCCSNTLKLMIVARISQHIPRTIKIHEIEPLTHLSCSSSLLLRYTAPVKNPRWLSPIGSQ